MTHFTRHPRAAVALFLTVAACFGGAVQAPGSDPKTVAVPDLDGNLRRPLADSGQKAVVLLFITTDCPVTNSYAPEMERIFQRYSPKGVRFYSVYVDPSISPAASRKHASDFGLTCMALYDAKHALVNRFKATVTPEAVVTLPDGSVPYDGRIDDRYIELGRARERVGKHDLTEALDAILDHRKVKVRTKAIGCYIPKV